MNETLVPSVNVLTGQRGQLAYEMANTDPEDKLTLKDEVVNSRPVVMEVQSFRQTLLGLVQLRIFLRLSNFQHVDCLCRNLAFGLVWWEGEDFRLGISRLNTGLPCSPATATFMSFAILRCKINDRRQPSSSSS